MRIEGIQKSSFVDYPGKIATVIFTKGCNMNCGFCHNKSLIALNDNENNNYMLASSIQTQKEDGIFNHLRIRKGFVDAVVITGGEPTLQEDLKPFIEKIKAMGYLIKLDTNGTNPSALQSLLKDGLLDYISMDLKAPLEKYNEICQVKVDIEKIIKSISLIIDSNIDYEFRTTFTPKLEAHDLYLISQLIYDASKYVIQQCRKSEGETEDNNDKYYLGEYCNKPIGKDIIKEIKNNVRLLEFRGEF